jgi:hypothetical protein
LAQSPATDSPSQPKEEGNQKPREDGSRFRAELIALMQFNQSLKKGKEKNATIPSIRI